MNQSSDFRYTNQILQGDSRECLMNLPDDSVHCTITSPPYFGQRDYHVDGQIGLEESIDEYIGSLLTVTDELKRVLHPTGSFWLNIGDTYAGGGGMVGVSDEHESISADHLSGEQSSNRSPTRQIDFENKQLLLLPSRIAIELQNQGWILRNRVRWVKKNAKPESMKDRLSSRVETIFHFTLQQDYWYNLTPIRKPAETTFNKQKNRVHPDGKNPGDVIVTSVGRNTDGHFAVFPKDLIRPRIVSTAPDTVCSNCGYPYGWKSELKGDDTQSSLVYGYHTPRGCDDEDIVDEYEYGMCDCQTNETVGGVVLDPFCGSGTTCEVARDEGRRFVGIELNPEYVALAEQNLGLDVSDPSQLRSTDDQSGLSEFSKI